MRTRIPSCRTWLVVAACLWLYAPTAWAERAPDTRQPLGGPSAREDRSPRVLADGWLERAVSRELATMNWAQAIPESRLLRGQQAGQQNRHWIRRHPVLVGTLIGFTTGYLIGYLPGDDGVFYDFTAEFNGLVVGTIGAGVGALVGAVVPK